MAQDERRKVNKKTDIVVVGGGPCGSLSAFTAARLGAEVSVFEEHKEIGVPKHCTGHLSIAGLKRLGLRLPHGIVENEFKGAIFHAPSGKKFVIRRSSPVTCVVNRELFDKYISNLAVKSGVQYFLESKVKSFLFDSSFVAGVAFRKGRVEKSLASSVVIDAEGCSSTLLKRTGLQTLNSAMVVNAVQAEVDHVDEVDLDMVEIYLGRKYAPGFFAWIIPKRDTSAKIGLAAKTGNPLEYLHQFLKKHPVASKKLRRSNVTNLSVHPIPLGGPVPKTYSNGLLAVGDVASQVKPTTGGGVIVGLSCSKIAGEVAYEAVKKNDFSEATLSQYQSRWKELIGFDLAVMRQTRKLLNRLNDRKIDKIVDLCGKLGVDSVLEEVGDLDFQGRALIRVIKHPTALIVALYFIFSSLGFSKSAFSPKE
jgi:digeranylgeranylglycerophospholipid reductase